MRKSKYQFYLWLTRATWVARRDADATSRSSARSDARAIARAGAYLAAYDVVRIDKDGEFLATLEIWKELR